MTFRSVSLSFLVTVAPCALGQAKHAFTPLDWAAMPSANPVAVSANGQKILYTVSHGAATGRDQVEWRLTNPQGHDTKKLALPPGFSPNGFTNDGGSLYGTYAVNGVPQLATFSLTGLQPWSVPTSVVFVPGGVRAASLSPKGDRFAILANPRGAEEPVTVHHVIQPEESSLYVVNVDGSQGQWWGPSLRQVGGSAWSPDGKEIAVLSSTPKIGFHFVKCAIDVCSSSGTRHVADIDGVASSLEWSVDGRSLLFCSTKNSVLTPDELWSVPALGGKLANLTPNLQGSVMGVSRDPKGRVWVSVNRGVFSEVDLWQDGRLTTAHKWPNGEVYGPVFSHAADADGQLVFAVGDAEHVINLAVPGSGGLRRITTEGDDLVSKIELGPVKVVDWKAKDGTALQGIVTFPPGFRQGEKHPYLVMPHGGPEGNDAVNLDAWTRILAGMGYVVMQPQYRGSTGYGDAFLDSIYQHFGDRAYSDVDSATDFAIAQGWADPDKLAIMGWSAGGFMTSWTVTQTHRYKAAVEGAGITDWASFIWTSDIQQIDYDARWPGKDPEAFRQFSAVDFVDQVTTPILILHGEEDVRVPTFQGREFYEALVANGKTARMVAYPGSGHFPSLWEQRLDVIKEATDWLKKYNP